MGNNFAIAPTDLNWFSQLRNNGFNQSEVNFWTPTPWNIKGLKTNDLLYFMLKSPIRKLGGYGKFSTYKNMSPEEAWNNFGTNNGVSNLSELQGRASFYIKKQTGRRIGSEIGCILLSEIELFDDDDFQTPEELLGVSFARQIVKIKIFDSIENNVGARSTDSPILDPPFQSQKHNKKKLKSVALTQRKGQTKFRNEVLNAYGGKCAITGTDEQAVLEAAHIENYINEHSNHINNGVCLRADIHKLFDKHLISVDEHFTVRVSKKINDPEYTKYNGRKLSLPRRKSDYPLGELLLERFSSFIS